jgi:hypothetical protein
VFKAEEGATMATGDGANISYSEFEEFPDARIGGYHYRPSGGATTVNHVIKVSSDGWATTDESDTWPVGGTFVNEDVASVASPRTEIQIRYQYVGGGFTADTKTWAYLHEFYVIAMRRDRNGDWIDSGTTYLGIPNALPTTGEIIIDLWARYCPRLDLPNARIDDSGMTHSDVVYPDGIDPQGVLEQLMERDPGHTWGLYERQDNGLFRAEWRTYDTDVRYELSTEDGGFSETSTTTKHDKIFATIDGSNSSTGRYAVRSFEDPDPQLAARGILPTMTVKTESDYWVTDEALKDMLDERTLEAGSAQLNINRRVLDHYTGRYVEPWEVLPGYLCRVAGAPRRNDVLNEFEPDGSAVVKLVSNEYNVAAGESKLELNGFTQTQLRALANLVQKQK